MASPFFSAYDTISTPNGTWIKPGGQVVAYVRSTGAQSGDLPEVVVNMVSTVAAGVARCRAGLNDVVMVLPGHTETVATTLFTPVSGAQVIGSGVPGAANSPNITLSATASTIALSAANMTVAGLTFTSTVAAITGAFVITGAGVTLANNFINCTGAFAANVPIQITGAANCTVAGNNIVVSSAAAAANAVVTVTGAASTNFVISDNFIRNIQAAGVCNFISTASTAGISGVIARNFCKTAATQTAGTGILPGAASAATVGFFENYTVGAAVAAAAVSTGATAA